jgi:hypothetical protein
MARHSLAEGAQEMVSDFIRPLEEVERRKVDLSRMVISNRHFQIADAAFRLGAVLAPVNGSL